MPQTTHDTNRPSRTHQKATRTSPCRPNRTDTCRWDTRGVGCRRARAGGLGHARERRARVEVVVVGHVLERDLASGAGHLGSIVRALGEAVLGAYGSVGVRSREMWRFVHLPKGQTKGRARNTTGRWAEGVQHTNRLQGLQRTRNARELKRSSTIGALTTHHGDERARTSYS